MTYRPESTLSDLLGWTDPVFKSEAVCVLNALHLPRSCVYGYAVRAVEDLDWHFHVQQTEVGEAGQAFVRGLQALIGYGIDRQLYLTVYQPLGKTLDDHIRSLITEHDDEKTYLSIREAAVRYRSLHLTKLPGECRPAWKELGEQLRHYREREEDRLYEEQRQIAWRSRSDRPSW